MLDHREELANGVSMAIESSEVYPSDTNVRRPGILSMKFRLREERKKVVGISSTKYNSIDDHETEMLRFCLIRNTLQRLQYEAREERIARHKAKANNVSPSYLSASRPRSPSPPYDMEVADVLNTYGQPAPTPITALSDDEDELPPCKRPRLFMDDEDDDDEDDDDNDDDDDDDDKENEMENSCEDRLIDVLADKDDHCSMNDKQLRLFMDDEDDDDEDDDDDDDDDKENDMENSCEDRLIDVLGDKDDHCSINDKQLIHKDVYESYTGDSISHLQLNSSPPPIHLDTNYRSGLCCNTTGQCRDISSSYNYSLSTILNCNSSQNTCSNNFNNGRCLNLSGCLEWLRPNHQYPCRHSALLGNDLQSVVYQSLITSL